tara:strand:- start:65 stop:274 length:210 start_codon:yes stop_codon:yes gene_type:complete
MKSTIRESEENEYPKLKINKSLTIIVLFTGNQKGVVVNSLVEDHEVGSTYQKWEENEFKNYNGTVTLEN